MNTVNETAATRETMEAVMAAMAEGRMSSETMREMAEAVAEMSRNMGWRVRGTEWATGCMAYRGPVFDTRADAERWMFNDTTRANGWSWEVVEVAW